MLCDEFDAVDDEDDVLFNWFCIKLIKKIIQNCIIQNWTENNRFGFKNFFQKIKISLLFNNSLYKDQTHINNEDF